MKFTSIIFIAVLLLLSSCKLFTALRSTTYIDSGKSFVLGEGQHASYKADVKNIGECPITILSYSIKGEESLLGTLQPNEIKSIDVAGNQMVCFRNENKEQAVISIKLRGTSNLTMSYEDIE
jgi:hypothetical protein